MFEPFFVLEGVGLLDSRDAIRRHGAEGSLNTERVWVVLAGSSSILSKRQNVPISHIVERAVPISHKRKIPVPLNHNPLIISLQGGGCTQNETFSEFCILSRHLNRFCPVRALLKLSSSQSDPEPQPEPTSLPTHYSQPESRPHGGAAG